MAEPLNIFVVSDATGTTAEAVVTSALVQFGAAKSRVRRFPFTRSVEEIEKIVAKAPEGAAVMVFTFVSRELSEAMIRLGTARGLAVVDVLSPLMVLFSNVLHDAPSGTPGLSTSPGEDMFKVIEAIHYTLRHDDGEGVDTLDEADLIILGVSRTGKTPTSIFLSCRKLKVANIPVIRGIPLPDEIAGLPVPKVGFRMDLERQVKVRSERFSRMQTRIPGYAERAYIMSEQAYCENVYRGIPGIQTVDVTYRSIEETSDWITHNVL